ncbi:helix-turn-helix domain-containing protein [Pedobacter sp. Leaf250]|uniref:helix-turn-helix domain-containing protein n=1 Tax=Pedobacter sp. Leaf250 TaxID=2876559 RepID=UPI001E3A534F|nr:helix-turn-helix transcriptional regulator [Pedobacter sp. Leaf250]
MKLFGDLLKELRVSRDLPLRKVAAFLDIDTSVLSKIERGERTAGRDVVLKVAQFYEIDSSVLLTDYLGEQVARVIFQENNCGEILDKAKETVAHLKDRHSEQGFFNFNNE